MTKFESDDLLIKSQMLISKFRKQREMALAQQSHQVYFPSKVTKYECPKNMHKKILSSYESYPEKEKDNLLLNKFINESYLTHVPNNLYTLKKDPSQNIDKYSSSESSIWSATSPKENIVEKVDFGMMTDSNTDIFKEVDEVITPITTLRAPRVENYSMSHFFKPKEFSSVSTQLTIKENNTMNVQKEPLEMFQKNKIPLINDEFNCKTDEEDKMNAAWEFFQEEKVLNKQIFKQMEIVDSLNREMEILRKKIESETHILELMNNDKENFRSQRYNIFSGLSKEPQANIKEESEEIFYDKRIMEQHHFISQHSHSYDQNINDSEVNNAAYVISSLDDDTVRNIVNRIVFKEFSNSEDKIFNKVFSNTSVIRVDEKSMKLKSSDDECVLSDVLSLKDLKIRPSSNNDTKTNTTTATSSMSLFNNSNKTIQQKQLQPKLKRKLRPAHSADNILQLSDNRKRKSRNNVRRQPSVIEHMDRLIYTSSSSSGESIFDSTIKERVWK